MGAGAMMAPGIIGGVASHMYDNVAETSPSAVAMRKESRRQEEKLRTGDFGASQAQKQGAYAQASSLLAAQNRQQGADLARAQAAGIVSGGAAAQTAQAQAQASQNAAAQAAGNIQASSDAQARNDYQNALGIVAAQRQHGVDFWNKQGRTSMTVTQNLGGGGSVAPDPAPSAADAAANKRLLNVQETGNNANSAAAAGAV